MTAVGPGQDASIQRRPRDQSHAGFPTELVHLPLLLTIEQRVVILHAHELGPTFQFRDLLHARKLIAPHAARAQVPHLSTLDQIM